MADTIVLPQNEDSDNADTGAEETGTQSDEKVFTQAEMERVIGDRLKREREKLASKYADYPELKKKAAASMSEQEKAVAEAEQRGRSAALQLAGSRLAKAEFKAAAAGKLSDEALSGFLDYVDVTKFLDSEGEPDTKAIAAAVKRLSGNAGNSGSNGSYDGGVRTPADKPKDMNAFIRQQSGHM
jgi:hypothetical protein